jgi:hypothetical protein
MPRLLVAALAIFGRDVEARYLEKGRCLAGWLNDCWKRVVGGCVVVTVLLWKVDIAMRSVRWSVDGCFLSWSRAEILSRCASGGQKKPLGSHITFWGGCFTAFLDVGEVKNMEDEDVHSLLVFGRRRFDDEASVATDWRRDLREWQNHFSNDQADRPPHDRSNKQKNRSLMNLPQSIQLAELSSEDKIAFFVLFQALIWFNNSSKRPGRCLGFLRSPTCSVN